MEMKNLNPPAPPAKTPPYLHEVPESKTTAFGVWIAELRQAIEKKIAPLGYKRNSIQQIIVTRHEISRKEVIDILDHMGHEISDYVLRKQVMVDSMWLKSNSKLRELNGELFDEKEKYWWERDKKKITQLEAQINGLKGGMAAYKVFGDILKQP